MAQTPGFERLRQAKLVQVVVVYAGACWGILEVTSLLKDELELPHWITPVAILLLGIGLVIIAATAWVQSNLSYVVAGKRLGEIYEGLGRPDEARAAYEEFVVGWKDADPELQPMVEEARVAAQRLTSVVRE